MLLVKKSKRLKNHEIKSTQNYVFGKNLVLL